MIVHSYTENLLNNTILLYLFDIFYIFIRIFRIFKISFFIPDLKIYHNSSNNNSVIQETGSGNLNINADNLQIRDSAGTEVLAVFTRRCNLGVMVNSQIPEPMIPRVICVLREQWQTPAMKT